MERVNELSSERAYTKSRFAAKKKNFIDTAAEDWQFWALCAPGLILLIVFSYVPMIGLILAFKNYSSLEGIFGSPWVGVQWFKDFFSSPFFFRTLRNTVLISVLKLVFSFPVPLLFAILLNEISGKWFKKTVQTISYMPHFISTVIVVGIMKTMLSPDGGVVNEVLITLGITKESISFFNEPGWFRTLYVGSEIWQNFGWDSIIYLACITSIDMQLYEAAQLDGAGRWKQTMHITLPGLKNITITMLILSFGSMMNVGFEKILLMYNPAVYETSDVISTYIYRVALVDDNIGYGVAVGLFNSVINLILIVVFNMISRKTSEVSMW